MPIQPGQTLSHYRLLEKIGEGGMGVVWKAVDTTLEREVAIKVLPDAFAKDSERLARFQREAKVLASLNHPNIAAIHSLHEAEGVRFLALELVDGEDLAQRLMRGPLPVDEALSIATQIAEALEAAHEAGVIHRDLKPANIKVRADGTVKVLDFGLAKALDTRPEGDPSQSPTLTAAATQMGVIMGTVAYMSPEQARGKPVDKRSDIWAFGSVLYEMLTARRAFPGEATADIVAGIIERSPDFGALPPNVPTSILVLVRRCLEKDRKERLHDIADARIEIKATLATPLIEEVERDAVRRHETDLTIRNQPSDSAKGGRDLRRQREIRREQKRLADLQLGGLCAAAFGVGLGIFLYFLLPERPIYVVGVIPFLVGLVMILYSFVLAPRPPGSGP